METSAFLTVLNIDSPIVAASVALTPHSASSTGDSGNYLSVADASSLHFTPTDSIIFGGWLKFTSLPGSLAVIASRGQYSGSAQSYAFQLGVDGAVNFWARDFGPSLNAASPVDPLSINTRYFMVGWVDSGAKTINFSLNSVLQDSEPWDGSAQADNGGPLSFFADNDGTSPINCQLDEWFLCKNPSNMTSALNVINTTIYNSGHGIGYSSLSSSDKTTLGLVSWWTFDEASASNRADSFGSNTATLHGTISQASTLLT